MKRPFVLMLLMVAALLVPPVSATAAPGVRNGDFTVADPLDPSFGWDLAADVAVVAGQAVLSEGGLSLPRLWQALTVPAGTRALRFDLAALDLRPNLPTEPVDAFEAHLLDAQGQSLLGQLPLSQTTAFFNCQQTGQVYFAPQVTVAGAPAGGGLWDAPSLPAAVTVHFDPVTTADIDATLMFILLGAGESHSAVTIDNVTTVADPVAAADQVGTLEDIPVDIAVLDNDRDPDGTLDPAGVTVVQGPLYGQTAVNPQTGVVTYTPFLDFHGVDRFSYTVRDNAGNVSAPAEVTVTVAPVNDPPLAAAGPDQTVPEGRLVTLDGGGSTDPEQDALEYRWEQTDGTPVSLSDPTAANPVFTAPDTGPAGETLVFALTVSDRGAQDPERLSSTDTCTVQVTWVNQPPVADAGPSRTVDEGDPVVLDGSASWDPDPDPDGIETYFWRQTAGPLVTLDDPASASPAFTAPDVGPDGAVLEFELTVTDRGAAHGAQDLSHTATVTVTVTWVDLPPTADAGGDRTVAEGTVVHLDGSGSFDPDDGIAAYLWTIVETEGLLDGEAVIFSDATVASPAFIAPRVGRANGRVTLRLTVTDAPAGQTLSDVDQITVTILNVVLPGDVDDSGVLELKDAVTVLQLLSRVPSGAGLQLTTAADRDGDGRLGVAEAVFILRRLSAP